MGPELGYQLAGKQRFDRFHGLGMGADVGVFTPLNNPGRFFFTLFNFANRFSRFISLMNQRLLAAEWHGAIAFEGALQLAFQHVRGIEFKLDIGDGGDTARADDVGVVVLGKAESFVESLDFLDRKSTRLNSSHAIPSRMPSSA